VRRDAHALADPTDHYGVDDPGDEYAFDVILEAGDRVQAVGCY
jgi:hypothetical protein